jgi:hypothetical protein
MYTDTEDLSPTTWNRVLLQQDFVNPFRGPSQKSCGLMCKAANVGGGFVNGGLKGLHKAGAHLVAPIVGAETTLAPGGPCGNMPPQSHADCVNGLRKAATEDVNREPDQYVPIGDPPAAPPKRLHRRRNCCASPRWGCADGTRGCCRSTRVTS